MIASNERESEFADLKLFRIKSLENIKISLWKTHGISFWMQPRSGSPPPKQNS
jgi:hypothetical protein